VEEAERESRHGPPPLVFVLAMPGWTIRSATEGDVSSVLGLWVTAGSVVSVSDTREGLSRLLATDRDALLIADLGGVLIGSLIAAWDGWRGSFYRLAVHPDRRRQGIATGLLREGERRLRARGTVRLTARRGRRAGLLAGCRLRASTAQGTVCASAGCVAQANHRDQQVSSRGYQIAED
jgi:GNAT superfamily N-acetyltransferase